MRWASPSSDSAGWGGCTPRRTRGWRTTSRAAAASEPVVVAEEVPGRAEEAAAQYGFASTTRDWRDVAADPRVRAVSITAPNFLHREIGVAMAEA